MSADNFILIVESEPNKYSGYMAFASDDMTTEEIKSRGQPMFEGKAIHEAIDLAQAEYTEYGFRVVALKENR